MLFSVPQYIDVEDKIAGPLTARQFLWLLAFGAVLIVLWNLFDNKATFYVVAFFLFLLFGAFAFYKPHGVSLVTFVGYALTFLIQPKIYVWRRPVGWQKKKITKKRDKYDAQFYKKSASMTIEDIAVLADVLDSEGHHRTDRAIEILESHATKNKK